MNKKSIKINTSFTRDGRVMIVAKKLKKIRAIGDATANVYRFCVLGALLTLFSFMAKNVDENGVLLGYEFEDIDDLIGIPNFCECLPECWIKMGDRWAIAPNSIRGEV